MAQGAWLLLMLLFGNWAPRPKSEPSYRVHLVARGKNDRLSQAFIRKIESMGRVLQMRDFDGKNIDLVWIPRPELFHAAGPSGAPLYQEELRAIQAAGGVEILRVKEQVPVT